MEDRKVTGNVSDHHGEEKVQRFRRRFIIAMAVLLSIHFGLILYYEMEDRKQLQNVISETETAFVRVIGNENLLELPKGSNGEEPDVDVSPEGSTISRENLDTFISMIFDAKSNVVGETQLKLSGLSTSTKKQMAFQEAEFVSELNGFLQEQDIRASEILFEKKIMTSAENVTGYLLEISGKEELQLFTFFFPNLPGQYLFTILEEESQESEESEVQSQVMQVEVPVPVQTESASNVNPYDASTLTIAGIPEKLLNYLANRYELQYSLYDYLYENGYRDVKKVTVESYEINADEKLVEMKICITDGVEITGTYQKENNRYTFYE